VKAITVRYKGPTDTKGSRLIASDMDGNRVTVGYPHELSVDAVYRLAADALCVKMEWKGEIVGGTTKPGEMVFVFTGRP
jgi:galactose mutarotase-like enzyme